MDCMKTWFEAFFFLIHCLLRSLLIHHLFSSLITDIYFLLWTLRLSFKFLGKTVRFTGISFILVKFFDTYWHPTPMLDLIWWAATPGCTYIWTFVILSPSTFESVPVSEERKHAVRKSCNRNWDIQQMYKARVKKYSYF